MAALSEIDLDGLQSLAERLANRMEKSALIYLNGSLGAGKTTFSQFLIQALGYSGRVKSPTYTLVEGYELPERTIYHFDLYRLADPGELEFIGWRDYLAQQAIIIVEWPEKGGSLMPQADFAISLSVASATTRTVEIAAHTGRGDSWLERMP